MARRIVGDPNFRTTDHAEEIATLHRHAAFGQSGSKVPLLAAAALLECHDATGIVLDDWTEVATFVNEQLAAVGLGPFMPSGV